MPRNHGALRISAYLTILALAASALLPACVSVPGTEGYRHDGSVSAAGEETDAGTPEHRESEQIGEVWPHTTEGRVGLIEQGLPAGTEILRDRGEPMMILSTTGQILGLARSSDAIYVVSARSSRGATVPVLQYLGESCTASAFQGHARNGPAHGAFEALLVCSDREHTLFVLPRDNAPPRILLEPLSAVSRSVLRDLTGNRFPELVRYSRIFEAGRGELMVEALIWNGEEFRTSRSTTLFRLLDARLDRLEEQLQDATPDDRFLRQVDRALQPMEDAPSASTVIPAEWVHLPRAGDVLLKLGEPAWRLDREIALDGHIYRFRIILEANPLLQNPVIIEGLDPH